MKITYYSCFSSFYFYYLYRNRFFIILAFFLSCLFAFNKSNFLLFFVYMFIYFVFLFVIAFLFCLISIKKYPDLKQPIELIIDESGIREINCDKIITSFTYKQISSYKISKKKIEIFFKSNKKRMVFFIMNRDLVFNESDLIKSKIDFYMI